MRPASRSELSRALVVNALAAPLNILLPTAVLIAAILLGAWWLAVVAIACWLGLAAHTFFDEREARRVGQRVRAGRRKSALSPGELNPLIGDRLKAAMEAREAIRVAIESSPDPLLDVENEVDELVAAIEADAARAQRIMEFLAGQESAASLERRIAGEQDADVRAALEAKHQSFERLRERLGRLSRQMDQVVATLQTVHAEIIAAEVVQEGELAGQVSELRAEVRLVAEGLEEAFAETRAQAGSADSRGASPDPA